MNINPFLIAAPFAKQAAQPADPRLTELAGQGLTNVLQLGAAGLGIGAATRGAIGLRDLFARALNPVQSSYPAAMMTSLPYPVRDDDEDPDNPRNKQKRAAFNGLKEWLGGLHYGKPWDVTDKTDFPWLYPAAVAATAGGAYAGYKGIDSVLQAQKQKQEEEELAGAKSDFEKALLSSYGQPKQGEEKTAGDELGEVLDHLYDACTTKQAEWPARVGNWTTGRYLAGVGLPLGALGAYWGYEHGQDASNRTVLEKAMRRRQQAELLAHPAEMYAVPTPVHVPNEVASDASSDDEAA
jgi:hypothetical protein